MHYGSVNVLQVILLEAARLDIECPGSFRKEAYRVKRNVKIQHFGIGHAEATAQKTDNETVAQGFC